MGAVFLYKDEKGIDLESVLNVFMQKGFKDPKKFVLGGYSILLYPKILSSGTNYVSDGIHTVMAVGSPIYKSLSYSDGMTMMFEDLKKEDIDLERIYGSYLIILAKGDKLSYVTDRKGIQNVYYSFDNGVISSSFLACAYSQVNPLTVNKDAVTEVLTTGSLIGPDTIFDQIKRLEKEDGVSFEGLERVQMTGTPFNGYCKKDYNSCLDDQIKTLDEYFSSVKALADGEGTDSGITGGHDSRLIMAMALKHFSNVSFHTHWRNKKNVEFISAQELCKKMDMDLSLIPVSDPHDMDESSLENNLEQAFLFFDGLVRMHSFWTEEYNTRAYREKILDGNRLGLSGIGGEQYRNEERMSKSSWDLKKVIKYKLLLNICGDCFKGEADLKKTISKIESKIRKKLSLENKKKINHLEYKKYLNEVFIPSRLGVRNNAENQLSFFLSPFTEDFVSEASYRIVNKLGSSLRFEEDMIKSINPELASIPSDKGFDFYKGEPLSNKIKSFVMDFIPSGILYKYYLKKKRGSIKPFETLTGKSKKLKDGVSLLSKLDLPIDLNKVALKPDLMPLILAMGYLLKRLEKKIDLNNAV